MADVWDLAQYVEAHPEEYEQRWRLAKKMFIAWEYRHALEHLQILKNEWEQRENVRRYLAATYYRLSRYDDAIAELNECIELWPDELEMRKQLARVYRVAERKKDALRVWYDVLEMDPGNKAALRAIDQLQDGDAPKKPAPKPAARPVVSTEDEDEEPFVADTGTAPKPVDEVICQSCGARNSAEFEQCWQCNKSLSNAAAYNEPPEPENPYMEGRRAASKWPLVAGFIIVGMLSGAIYTTGRHFFPTEELDILAGVRASFFDFYLHEFATTRIVCGCILLLVWPLALRYGAHFAGADNVDSLRLYVGGAFLTVLLYLLTWQATPSPVYSPLIVFGVSMILCLFAFEVKPLHALLIWTVQTIIVLLLVLSILAAMHGFNFVWEIPAMARYARSDPSVQILEFEGTVPEVVDVMWERTESEWLNSRFGYVAFETEPGPFTKRVFVELNSEEALLFYQEINAGGTKFDFEPVKPGIPYRIELSGEVGIPIKVRVWSQFALVAEHLRDSGMEAEPSDTTAEPEGAVEESGESLLLE